MLQPKKHLRLNEPFVDQVHQVASSDRLHVGDSENETYRVEDVGLSGTVQTCNSVERLVEAYLLALPTR